MKISKSKNYVSGTDAETPFGHVSIGDVRRGSDPMVQALPGLFVEWPATANELLAHASLRNQAAFDAAQRKEVTE
jgi:hypothetical protein